MTRVTAERIRYLRPSKYEQEWYHFLSTVSSCKTVMILTLWINEVFDCEHITGILYIVEIYYSSSVLERTLPVEIRFNYFGAVEIIPVRCLHVTPVDTRSTTEHCGTTSTTVPLENLNSR